MCKANENVWNECKHRLRYFSSQDGETNLRGKKRNLLTSGSEKFRINFFLLCVKKQDLINLKISFSSN